MTPRLSRRAKGGFLTFPHFSTDRSNHHPPATPSNRPTYPIHFQIHLAVRIAN